MTMKRRVSTLSQGICLAALLCFAQPSHAQGCSQCKDNAAATPPRTQAAYRRAIILMTVTATTLFAGTVLLFKRIR